MGKDSRYELLEDRISQLEDIIDGLIIEGSDEPSSDSECFAILPSSVVEEMEKIIKSGIYLIGIT